MSQGLIAPDILIPPGMDQRQFLLSLPAMDSDQIPPGENRTMTPHGPDQVWFLVTAVTCVVVPGLFLILRLYTKLAIVRSLELADCKLSQYK